MKIWKRIENMKRSRCFAHAERESDSFPPDPVEAAHVGEPRQAPEPKPKWVAKGESTGKLFFGEALIKEHKQPSPNQTRVLAAFEEETWPDRIDDPLPAKAEMNPKRRLSETIESLNRNQRHRGLIRFRGDGTQGAERRRIRRYGPPHEGLGGGRSGRSGDG